MSDQRIMRLYQKELECLTEVNPMYPTKPSECSLFYSWFRVGYACYQTDNTATIIKLLNKIGLLKELLLLTHESVSDQELGELQAIQWREFIKQFPEEV